MTIQFDAHTEHVSPPCDEPRGAAVRVRKVGGRIGSYRIGFFPQECLQLFPRAKQMAGLDVMDQARIRIDPLRLPSIAAYMFKDPHAFDGCLTLLA